MNLWKLHLDFDIDAGRKIEIAEGINRLRGRGADINEALVNAHFELFARVFVDESRAIDRVLRLFGGQRHRTNDGGAGPLGSVNDLAGRLVYELMVISPDLDSNSSCITAFLRHFSIGN